MFPCSLTHSSTIHYPHPIESRHLALSLLIYQIRKPSCDINLLSLHCSSHRLYPESSTWLALPFSVTHFLSPITLLRSPQRFTIPPGHTEPTLLKAQVIFAYVCQVRRPSTSSLVSPTQIEYPIHTSCAAVGLCLSQHLYMILDTVTTNILGA